MNNSEIRMEARELLNGKWNKSALVWLIYIALTSGANAFIPGFGQFVMLFVGGAFTLGICDIFLKIYRREDFIVDDLFSGFKDYSRSLVAFLLVSIYVLLWSLLLIVPGIIAAISYSQTFYLMKENPGLEASQAIEMSKKMMYGHKSEYFMLMLSFIGWAILCGFTMGIGFFWLSPYVEASKVIFYKRLCGLAQ